MFCGRGLTFFLPLRGTKSKINTLSPVKVLRLNALKGTKKAPAEEVLRRLTPKGMTSTPVLSTWWFPLLERKAWFLSLFMVTDISLKLIFLNLLSPYTLCYCLFSYLTVTVRVNIKFFLTKHVISLIAHAVAI